MIATEEKQQTFGVAYAKGVLDYLGMSWQEPNTPRTLYGVAQQVIALSDKESAQKYASMLNTQNNGSYYKVLEINA